MSFQRRKVLKALQKRGFFVIREGGNHTILQDADGREVALPRHNAGADWNEFKGEVS